MSESLFVPMVQTAFFFLFFFSLHAITFTDLQESDDHNISRVNEGLNGFGVGQPGKGTVWNRSEEDKRDTKISIVCVLQSLSLDNASCSVFLKTTVG